MTRTRKILAPSPRAKMSALKEKIEGVFEKPIKTEVVIKRAQDLISRFSYDPGHHSTSVGNFGKLGTEENGERHCGSLGVHRIEIGW